MSRPELQRPPDLFYNESEAAKYTSSSRIIQIQDDITNRAIELLSLPPDEPALILDIGCGSGLSGKALEEAGYHWIGCDISRDMLNIAAQQGSETGDVMEHDMGKGLPFRQAMFDGAISISALQWLCYSDLKTQSARTRLTRFFSSLYSCLKRTAKAALQFYPENPEQALLIASCASSVGFKGGLVVDYPNSSKAKKYYLCLGFEQGYRAPSALGSGAAEGPQTTVQTSGRTAQKKRKGKKQRAPVKSREWVELKKEKRRREGKEARKSTRFTARKRKDKF